MKIGGLIVRRSSLPTTIEDANPLERQRAHRCLVRASFVALLAIVGGGPEGAGNGGAGPFDKGLPEERGTLQSPVDPVLLATALGDRSDAGVALNLAGALIALTLFTESGEQSRGEGYTGTGQRSKQGVVGQGFAHGSDLAIEARDGLQRHAQLCNEGEHQELVGQDHGQVVGQWGGALDGFQPLVDARWRAHVVVMKERLQSRAAGALE